MADKLPKTELMDIMKLTAVRMADDMSLGFQLVDDPHQRAVFSEYLASAVVNAAALMMADAFHRSTGKRVNHEAAVLQILEFCRKHPVDRSVLKSR